MLLEMMRTTRNPTRAKAAELEVKAWQMRDHSPIFDLPPPLNFPHAFHDNEVIYPPCLVGPEFFRYS